MHENVGQVRCGDRGVAESEHPGSRVEAQSLQGRPPGQPASTDQEQVASPSAQVEPDGRCRASARSQVQQVRRERKQAGRRRCRQGDRAVASQSG